MEYEAMKDKLRFYESNILLYYTIIYTIILFYYYITLYYYIYYYIYIYIYIYILLLNIYFCKGMLTYRLLHECITYCMKFNKSCAYAGFLDLRTQIFDICEMKKRVVKLYSVGKSSVSSQHSSTSSSSSSSSNDEANKNDDAVSYSLAYPATSSPSDESTSHTSKVFRYLCF